MADIPHFDLPFRLVGDSPAVNEQDSVDDVAACVEAVLRYRPGQRELLPDFGTPEIVFQQIPVDTVQIIDDVSEWEPRAAIVVNETPDRFDTLIDHISVAVNASGAEA